ncbi:MAG TPA: class IV adenylate cyclase, partial [Methanocorpusculum sp.]|nr:class IV adenylate cyclase [Methanocorpusculum sp.]
MALEIEIKVKVPALEPIRENLKKNGAELIAEQDEHDIYYNAPHKDFAVTDEALRVRYTQNQTCGKIMPPNVTYKGPKVGREGFKAREEIIVDISSGEQFATILERLNFTKTAEVIKHREIYQCEKAIVTLDNVAEVGTFSEIEADFS